MKNEIEAKFINIDVEALREKLRAAGAECEQPMRLMRRAVFDNEFMKTDKDGFLRVRDEGNRTTMTYKQFDDMSIDGVKEVEVETSDYEITLELLAQIGMTPTSVQETKRETWRLGDVELMIDEWPWLQPFVEIEGESEAAIRAVAERLEFDWNEAKFGGVMRVYQATYPHVTQQDNISTIPVILFDDPLPRMLIPSKKVAKVVMIDEDDNYLMMLRSDHPTFPNDPDLPGGTVEADEAPLQAMLREVTEEAGVKLGENSVEQVYQGAEYSAHGTQYSLFVAHVGERPEITISWEHAGYEWVSRQEFLAKAGAAKDTFMKMVAEVMEGRE